VISTAGKRDLRRREKYDIIQISYKITYTQIHSLIKKKNTHLNVWTSEAGERVFRSPEPR
jgi:hypothetical protein